MAFNEKLEVAELSATNTIIPLLNLNDGAAYFIGTKTFKVIAPAATRVEAVDQRRWGGAKQVGEVHANAAVTWEATVAGTSEQNAIERVETLLAQLAANPTKLRLLWQAAGVNEPTLYEVRGTGHWEALFDVGALEGAGLFPIQVEIPVAPLACALPVKLYEASGLTLPATLSLGTVAGDAPALCEVSIEAGSATEESFITGAGHPCGVAVDGTFIYFCNSSTGYIGRAKLNGTGVERTWLHVEGEPIGVAVNASNVFWTDFANNRIGRATIAGGTIEKTWITGANEPTGIAVNASNVIWANYGSGYIARATLAGGTIEQTWINTGTGAPQGVAINSAHVFWVQAEEQYIGRATLAGGSIEQKWLKPAGTGAFYGIAVDAHSVYYGNYAQNSVGRAALNGEEVNATWLPVGTSPITYGIAVNSEYCYVANLEADTILRAKLVQSPVWALFGWAAKPTTGLATAPFGLLGSSEAAGTEWSYGTVAGAQGGKALHGSDLNPSATWEVDPATLTPDSFSNEVTLDVYARVLVSSGLTSATLTLSAQPQDGLGFGAPRYTDEWGSGGRTVILPSEGEQWRMTRLGTLHLLVNPLAPRIWKLIVAGAASKAAEWGIDSLLIVPSKQRACSPTSKPYGASYPEFIANLTPTVKTIKPDLSATIAKPGKYGHPDHGLGGQLLQLPTGEVSMLLKLSNLIPDSEASTPSTEQLAYEGVTVTVTVTPRYFLTQTA